MRRLFAPVLSAVAAGAAVAALAGAAPSHDPSTCQITERPTSYSQTPVAVSARCNLQTAVGRTVVFMHTFEDGSVRVSTKRNMERTETLEPRCPACLGVVRVHRNGEAFWVKRVR